MSSSTKLRAIFRSKRLMVRRCSPVYSTLVWRCVGLDLVLARGHIQRTFSGHMDTYLLRSPSFSRTRALSPSSMSPVTPAYGYHLHLRRKSLGSNTPSKHKTLHVLHTLPLPDPLTLPERIRNRKKSLLVVNWKEVSLTVCSRVLCKSPRSRR